ncbi:hypothetical protein TWF694_005844 [Orbilia ellipsospora]|uniref:Uncharacterized protein n=1 Tax=Orbilia ellipsospora TaxID=2528407 RepID=A0AAV9WS33_9PEZI
MMFLTRLIAAFLLGTVTVASPVQVSCPVPTVTSATVYLPTPTTSTALSIGTIWQTFYTVGEITSTQHSNYVYTFTETKTIYSPKVTTIPTSTFSSTITAPASTSTWITITLTSTLPGSASSDPCFVTTCIQTVSPTSTVTITYPVLYAYGYTTLTDHVSTSTRFVSKTTTQTITTAQSTKVLKIVTVTSTYTPLLFTAATEWKSVYATPIPTVCG